jgi:hypothetical protein
MDHENIKECRCILLSGKYNGVMNASSMARLLGRRGGLARGRSLSGEARRRIASLGGRARRESLEAARRIEDNFRYAAAVEVLGGGARPVRRVKQVTGRLPGLYR